MITLVSKILSGKIEINWKVRVIYLSIIPDRINPAEDESLCMLLLDEKVLFLYIRFGQCQQIQMSEIINASEEDSPTIILNEDVEEENEEENEAQVGHYFTSLFEEGDHVESKTIDVDDQHILVRNVFCTRDRQTCV